MTTQPPAEHLLLRVSLSGHRAVSVLVYCLFLFFRNSVLMIAFEWEVVDSTVARIRA